MINAEEGLVGAPGQRLSSEQVLLMDWFFNFISKTSSPHGLNSLHLTLSTDGLRSVLIH